VGLPRFHPPNPIFLCYSAFDWLASGKSTNGHVVFFFLHIHPPVADSSRALPLTPTPGPCQNTRRLRSTTEDLQALFSPLNPLSLSPSLAFASQLLALTLPHLPSTTTHPHSHNAQVQRCQSNPPVSAPESDRPVTQILPDDGRPSCHLPIQQKD
jgi:hypothetical protein